MPQLALQLTSQLGDAGKTWVPATAKVNDDGISISLVAVTSTPGQHAIASRYAQVRPYLAMLTPNLSCHIK